MTDREILELAAKAAGFDVSHFDRDKRAMVVFAIDGDENPDQEYWNPLTDDGDALRLAVKLGICVTPYPIFANPKHSVIAKLYQSRLNLDRGLSTAIEIIELYNNDPYAATRRAIVRAAAEIGKAMK